jgi:hypothetical protein
LSLMTYSGLFVFQNKTLLLYGWLYLALLMLLGLNMYVSNLAFVATLFDLFFL